MYFYFHRMIYSAKLGTFFHAPLNPSPFHSRKPCLWSSSDLHKCSSHFQTISPRKDIHFKIMLLSMIMFLKGLFPCKCFNKHIPHFLAFPMLYTTVQWIRKIFCRYLGDVVSKVWKILEYQVLCNFVVLITGKLQIATELSGF
jgi:hypothetical protein